MASVHEHQRLGIRHSKCQTQNRYFFTILLLSRALRVVPCSETTLIFALVALKCRCRFLWPAVFGGQLYPVAKKQAVRADSILEGCSFKSKVGFEASSTIGKSEVDYGILSLVRNLFTFGYRQVLAASSCPVCKATRYRT